MRRIDAIVICVVFGLTGGLAYGGLLWLGLPTDKAETWTPVFLLGGILAWLATYLTRVFTGKMTYHEQLAKYKTAVLAKKLAEMSPAEIAQLLQEPIPPAKYPEEYPSECKE